MREKMNKKLRNELIIFIVIVVATLIGMLTAFRAIVIESVETNHKIEVDALRDTIKQQRFQLSQYADFRDNDTSRIWK